MNDIYPFDIWHVIFHHCDLLSQLRLFTVCSDFYQSFAIIDLYNMSEIYHKKLTNSVLQQRKFNRLVQLDIRYNRNITDISFLTTLKKLCIGSSCKIDQQGIQGLDLVELNANFNETIKDISSMTNLKKLNICSPCGINQQSIRGLVINEMSFIFSLKPIFNAIRSNP